MVVALRYLIAVWTAVAVVVTVSPAPHAAERIVYSFQGGTDGSGPQGGAVAGAFGALYGTTQSAGTGGCGGSGNGCGTVFSVTPDGTETVLYSFAGAPDADSPQGTLFADRFGALYGTSVFGGGGMCSNGCGAVFRLTPPRHPAEGWSESVLYSFCPETGCADGAFPTTGLVADAQGALYGTTNEDGPNGGGTVFRLAPAASGRDRWRLTTLYGFCAASGCPDGSNPNGRLAFDADGNLYGTTTFGGAAGQGTVFKLTRHAHDSWTETVLYSFCAADNCSDGKEPVAGLAIDPTRALYGTTPLGGANGDGLVFRLAPPGQGSGGWRYADLHDFDGVDDGSFSEADLVSDAAGAFYGSAAFGGSGSCQGGCGTLFRLTPAPHRQWKFTLVHTFDSAAGDGAQPRGPVAFLPGGAVFGTTQDGGDDGVGTVFRLPPAPAGR